MLRVVTLIAVTWIELVVGAIAQSSCNSLPAGASCYYVSSSTGSDDNDGLAKTTGGGHGPWAHAPGMLNAATNVNSNGPANYTSFRHTSDQIIVKGCDVWTNSSLVWAIVTPTDITTKGSYSTSSYVMGDFDKTWYNTTNCPSGWDRPILDACLVAAAPSGGLPGCTGANIATTSATDSTYPSGGGNVIYVYGNSITVSGFEIRNQYNKAAVNVDYHGSPNTIKNIYDHAWITPYVKTTGTVTGGSTTVQLDVGTDMSQILIPAACSGGSDKSQCMQIEVEAIYHVWGNISNGVNVVGKDAGAHTVTVDQLPCAGGSNSCTGGVPPCTSVACSILIGQDYAGFVSTASNQGNTVTVDHNVIDGSDTQPMHDGCGADPLYGCMASGAAFSYVQIITNNYVNGVSNGYTTGSPQQFSFNTILNARGQSTNPSNHTNTFQSTGDLDLFVMNDNVFGDYTSGQSIQWSAPAAKTSFIWNNVAFNGQGGGGTQCFQPFNNSGTYYEWNNTCEAGPNSGATGNTTTCGTNQAHCYIYNEHGITTQTAPAIATCGANCTQSGNLTTAVASLSPNFALYNATFAFQPLLVGASTVGAGTATDICATVTALNPSITTCNKSAGYGVQLVANCTGGGTNCAEASALTVTTRPATHADVGAYQFNDAGGFSIKGVTISGIKTQ